MFAFRAQISELVKLVAEHGIARIAVVGGLAIVIYLLFSLPHAAWQINVTFIAGAVTIVAAGSFVRWAEMRYNLLSGRTMVLRCAKCREPLTFTPMGEQQLIPPLFIQCSNKKCKAINLVQ